MKKFLTFILAVAMLLCVTACGSNRDFKTDVQGDWVLYHYYENAEGGEDVFFDETNYWKINVGEDSFSEMIRITILIDDFEFEEERLANAYAELPLMRRQILKMLFVDEMKPSEIAKRLNCSPEYVSHQRYKGLRYLKKKMTEGGDGNGQG